MKKHLLSLLFLPALLLGQQFPAPLQEPNTLQAQNGTLDAPYVMTPRRVKDYVDAHGGGGGTPGVPLTSFQYNNGGALAGATGITFGGTAGKITLGVAGTSVGTVDFKNATSGTASLLPPTGALGTFSVTLPSAASTLPIYGVQMTYIGPSAPRTVTYPDVNFTVLYNGGPLGTPVSGVATNLTGTAAGLTAGNVTTNANLTGPITSVGNATSIAAQTGTGSTFVMQTSPSLITSLLTSSTTFALLNVTPTTINAFGNATTINMGNSAGTTNLLGLLALNPGSGVAGVIWSGQGTAPTPPANSIGYYSPTSVPAAYGISFPSAPTTGLVFRTGTGSSQAESIVAILAVANGGTGTATPALVAGTNVTITGTWPNQTINSSSASTGANPTGTIGLTAVNGSATTFLRSDGAPPLSQAITPTWTNLHTFSAGLTSTAGTNSLAPFVDSVDGVTPLNNINQVVAAGTAYTMTATYGSLTFGTTSPILTIANAGTYAVYVDVQLNLVGATYVTYDSASIKLRRTNNTAADLAGSTFGTFIPTISTITAVGPYLHVGPIKYTTTNTNDTITVQGTLGTLPSAGSVTATAVTITAIRAY